jgi:hypothetical protein
MEPIRGQISFLPPQETWHRDRSSSSSWPVLHYQGRGQQESNSGWLAPHSMAGSSGRLAVSHSRSHHVSFLSPSRPLRFQQQAVASRI